MTYTDYKELMAGKSEEDLRVYLASSVRYTHEAVNAAIAELEHRGLAITVEERKQLEEGFAQKALNSASTSFYARQKKLQTEDPTAPLLYTKSAIVLFSAFVNGVFGTVLMAINIRKNKLPGFYPVLLIGLGLSIAAYALLHAIPRSTGLTMAVNLMVGTVLTGPLWNKYIGKETMHRPRAIWVPLAVALVIFGLVIALVVRYSA